MPSVTEPMSDIAHAIARECRLASHSVAAALSLFGSGATVPFVARYRKEATGGLDEVALRTIAERHKYLLELNARRIFVKDAIAGQGKLTPELEAALSACTNKTELEDLYAPFKSKRRTRAQLARELGLEPLANLIWNRNSKENPEAHAAAILRAHPEIGSAEAAIDGAIDICAERIAVHPQARQCVRDELARGLVRVKKAPKHRKDKTKFDNYDDYAEPIARIMPHRYLAICRGESEGILKLAFELDDARVASQLERIFAVRGTDAWTKLFRRAIDEALSRLLLPSARSSVRGELARTAELAAVQVFAKNLEKLLLAAPFGARSVLGIDPGQRTGCKCAVVDATGALIEHTLFNLVQGESAERAAEQVLAKLLERHPIAAIAVGNGTHGRETEAFVRATLKKHRHEAVLTVSVNEAGASVYSASEVARQELPDYDVTVRGAVSIARRLQDPLSELVKIDPKSVGVGQYQHDVSEVLLGQKLGEVVESCVNRVGVELNTASPSLLAYVSGIGDKLARKIVEHRTQNGKFASRAELKRVAGLGARSFEQAAGFLRVQGASNPLDASGVHPERYALVERMGGIL